MSALDDFLSTQPVGSAPNTPQNLDALIARDSAVAPAPVSTAATEVAPPQAGAAQSSGYLAALGAGLGHGFGSTMLGAQQLLGRGAQAIGLNSVGDWLAKDAGQGIKNLDAQYAPYSGANPTMAGIGNVGGVVAAGAPLALAAPEMAGAGVLGRVGTGAALGAANGLISPVTNVSQQPGGGDNYWPQKLGQVGLSAAVGGVATPLTGLLGDAVSGVTDPIRQRLAQAGVQMTPGQIAGGAWSGLENRMTSLPIVGDVIKGAQQRGVQSFNNATYNEVLAPIGKTFNGAAGNDGVEAVQRTIGDAYDNALSNMTFRATDPQFQSSISNLASLAQGLPAAQQQTFKNVLQTQVFGKLSPQGWMDGPTLKGAQSELSRIARGYAGDPSFDNRQLGVAVGEIKNAIDNSLPNYNTPAAVQGLQNANAAWSNFVRLRSAAGSQGAMNNGGIFTPAQLQNAVRSADQSVGKGATATGNAPMQGFSSDAMSVLGKSYPDSGTAGRVGTAGAIGALLSHPSALMNPYVIGAAIPAAAYTPLGQRAAQALLMSRPAGAQAVGNAITNRLAPLVPSLLPAFSNSGTN